MSTECTLMIGQKGLVGDGGHSTPCRAPVSVILSHRTIALLLKTCTAKTICARLVSNLSWKYRVSSAIRCASASCKA